MTLADRRVLGKMWHGGRAGVPLPSNKATRWPWEQPDARMVMLLLVRLTPGDAAMERVDRGGIRRQVLGEAGGDGGRGGWGDLRGVFACVT